MLLLGAVAAVAVIGSACGQYPGVHRDPVVRERAASVRSPQPASTTGTADTTGASGDVSTAPRKGADGASGPGPHAVSGGSGPTVDLSRIFPVQHPSGSGTQQPGSRQSGSQRSSGPGSSGTKSGSSSGSSSSNAAGNSKGSKGDSNGTASNRKQGSNTGSGSSQPGIQGDDGANPGPPDISGSIGPDTPPGGSLDLASLISRETVQGAKYNSTVLPVGFPFSICPVQGKYSYSDSYGAPRYAGGYHPHAGVDIFADQGTPIVAPFAGYVERDPNTLGGNAVIVRGAQGYVYMAHLVAYGITDRNVDAGTVVGFVGNTGDAQGTAYHDHFEWHPNHVAAYDRVISGTNGAVDEFPYLQVVCPPTP